MKTFSEYETFECTELRSEAISAFTEVYDGIERYRPFWANPGEENHEHFALGAFYFMHGQYTWKSRCCPNGVCVASTYTPYDEDSDDSPNGSEKTHQDRERAYTDALQTDKFIQYTEDVTLYDAVEARRESSLAWIFALYGTETGYR